MAIIRPVVQKPNMDDFVKGATADGAAVTAAHGEALKKDREKEAALQAEETRQAGVATEQEAERLRLAAKEAELEKQKTAKPGKKTGRKSNGGRKAGPEPLGRVGITLPTRILRRVDRLAETTYGRNRSAAIAAVLEQWMTND